MLDQQRKLGQTAKMLGKSVSELVREILQHALAEREVWRQGRTSQGQPQPQAFAS